MFLLEAQHDLLNAFGASGQGHDDQCGQQQNRNCTDVSDPAYPISGNLEVRCSPFERLEQGPETGLEAALIQLAGRRKLPVGQQQQFLIYGGLIRQGGGSYLPEQFMPTNDFFAAMQCLSADGSSVLNLLLIAWQLPGRHMFAGVLTVGLLFEDLEVAGGLALPIGQMPGGVDGNSGNQGDHQADDQGESG